MSKGKRYFVEAVRGRKGVVIGYGVYDVVNGMQSEHARYEVTGERSADIALHLANEHRDDMNNEVA